MRNLKHRNLLFIGIACLLFASAAFAQDRDVTRQELANFDKFLDSHPAINKDLQGNP